MPERSLHSGLRKPAILSIILSCVLLIGAGPWFGQVPDRYKQVRRYWRALTGSLTPRKQFDFVGKLDATTKGKAAIALQMKELWSGHQFVIANGSIKTSGQMTALVTGSTLPHKLRMQMRRLSSTDKPLTTKAFDILVGSDGKIAPQSFPLTVWFLVDYKETLEFSIAPLDANLPAGTLTLTVSLNPPSWLVPEESLGDTPADSPATAQKVQYTYAGYPAGAKKGQAIGHVVLNPIAGSAFTAVGKLAVKGKIVPDSGEALPSKLRAVLKHIDSTGRLLSTDKFDIKIQTAGNIASQSFPFSTVNAGGVKESWDVSFVPIDRDLPDCELNLVAAFTATVGP